MSVNGWASRGGAELGTNRPPARGPRALPDRAPDREQKLDGLMMIGGWSGLRRGRQARRRARALPGLRPADRVPAAPRSTTTCPARSSASQPATPRQNIVGAVDKIKTTAVASQRCFVVEVMGRRCGYLALLSAFATGAERVYMHEDGVTLADLQRDLERLKQRFRAGKRLGLLIPQRGGQPVLHDARPVRALRAGGRGSLRRQAGSWATLQQGGDPTAFDRILATRLAALSVDYLVARAEQEALGRGRVRRIREGKLKFTPSASSPSSWTSRTSARASSGAQARSRGRAAGRAGTGRRPVTSARPPGALTHARSLVSPALPMNRKRHQEVEQSQEGDAHEAQPPARNDCS